MKEVDSTSGVAEYLQCSEEYLKKLRMKGEGPLYFKIGRNAMYRKFDVDAWIDTRICGSTFEYKQNRRFAAAAAPENEEKIG